MRKTTKTSILKLVFIAAIFFTVAGVVSVSAAPIGESYPIMGYNSGWSFLIIGLILGFMGMAVQALDKYKKMFYGFALALILIGAILLTLEVAPAVTVPDTDTTCCDFDFTGSAITGGSLMIDTTWNEETDKLTIPLNVNDSSDGEINGGTRAGVNISLEALGGETTQNCVFTITLDIPTYSGEDVIDESGDDTLAIIHTEDGTEYVTDRVQITAGSTEWVNITYCFINATSGSWVSELDAVGDGFTWYAHISNGCGDSRTITFETFVTDYTA